MVSSLLPGYKAPIKREKVIMTESFIKAIKHIAGTTAENMHQLSHAKSSRDAVIQRKKELLAIADGRNGNGYGIDLEITKLNKLPVLKYSVLDVYGQTCIAALTKPLTIICTTGRYSLRERGNPSGWYKAPSYQICVPLKAFRTYSANQIMCIPEGSKPLSDDNRGETWTHHHYGQWSGELRVHTCWGDFEISGYLYSGTTSSLFKTLIQYVCVDNPSSYLTHSSIPSWKWVENRDFEKEGLTWPMV